jgi:hypothetical protein
MFHFKSCLPGSFQCGLLLTPVEAQNPLYNYKDNAGRQAKSAHSMAKRFTIRDSLAFSRLARASDRAAILQKACHIWLGHFFDSCFPALLTWSF